MATSAERRKQLEYHLNTFKEISNIRLKEKMNKWIYHIPAIVSSTIIICQLINTILFGIYSYNFGKLYILLDEYMYKTNGTSINNNNETDIYLYDGSNFNRILTIDLYHDKLWTIFVSEIIELIFPLINIILFIYVTQQGKFKLSSKIKVIYLLCPALALLLSISQACMIHVTLSEAVDTVRFFLAKLLAQLLIYNNEGRKSIEDYFECEFINDDDIVKPSCSGTIHDQVVSPFTLNIIIILHILPVIIFLYLIIKNLAIFKTERLFLYIESVDANGCPYVPDHVDPEDNNNRTLKTSIQEMLSGFNIRFQPKHSFNEKINQKISMNNGLNHLNNHVESQF